MSLKTVFEQNPERRYIMFGGKGGLGKTTFSAATAYWLAKQGHKVLVFSVDPQASLSDIFKRDIFGKGPVEIMPNLFAQEIDADRRIKDASTDTGECFFNFLHAESRGGGHLDEHLAGGEAVDEAASAQDGFLELGVGRQNGDDNFGLTGDLRRAI